MTSLGVLIVVHAGEISAIITNPHFGHIGFESIGLNSE
jgi:hypothetical protein